MTHREPSRGAGWLAAWIAALAVIAVGAPAHAAAAGQIEQAGQIEHKAPLDHASRDRRFALVIGYNGSDDPNLPTLRYADDDAVRDAQLLGDISDRVITLTDLDAESRALWGNVAVRPPTRHGVVLALRELRRQMAVVRRQGDRPILYFVYSGHGNYDATGRGYVYLQDGRFTTRDLYHDVIVPSDHDPVVLIVDACNAALLVNSRGAPAERRPAGPTTLKLERYPNVGVILASSSIGETREWGRYLAGIFSHEVRSGLLGPADINGDGRVTFAELAAFVDAANARVTNPTVRITPYIRPPLAEPNLVLVDRRTARFPAWLRLGKVFSGKAYLVDHNLVREADFNKSPGRTAWLALPGTDGYTLVREDTEYVVPPGARGEIEVAHLETRKRTVLSARGAGSVYFDRTLFRETYSPRFARQYLTGAYLPGLEVTRLVRRPWYDNAGAWLLAGAGVASLAAGLGLQVGAWNAQDRARRMVWGDQRQHGDQMRGVYQAGAYVLYGASASLAIGSALWLALDRPVAEEHYHPPLSVFITPGGIVLHSSL